MIGADSGAIMSAVEDQFEVMTDYATRAWEVTSDYLELISNTLVSFSPDFVKIPLEIGEIPIYDFAPERPDRPVIEINLPSIPVMGVLDDVEIDPTEIPDITFIPPVLLMPDKPDVSYPGDPGDAPLLETIEFPSKPDINLPIEPVIDEITIPTCPEISMLSFEGTLPDIMLNDLVVSFNFGEELYDKELALDIKTRLLALLESGGTGLGAEVEDAIWERARDRTALQKERVYQEALEFFASRGWIIPPGALSARLTEALKEQLRADDQINYEIMIKQAELADQNTRFAIEAGINLESKMMEYSGQIAGRALESAKYAQDAAIKVFSAVVAKHNLNLDIYKTSASVYESKIRASLLILERYKSVLQGLQLTEAIQRDKIEIYKSQIGAVTSLINLYAIDMESARIRTEVSKQIVETYKAEIGAYTARIGAITSRYNAYQAEIGGEALKANVYESQVKGYLGEVEAAKTVASIGIAEANITIEKNKMLSEQFKSEIAGYNAEVTALVDEAKTNAIIYGYDVAAFDVDVKLVDSQIDGYIKTFDTQMKHEEVQVSLSIKQAELNMEEARNAHQLQITSMVQGATIMSQTAASALSSVSAAAQMSYRYGFDKSKSESESDSVQTQHIYRH